MAFDKYEFEDNLRAFVAKGSHMQKKYVHPRANVGPKSEECFASVLLITEEENGWPAYTTRYDEDSDTHYQAVLTPVIASYSVQWYRNMATARAARFTAWAKSDMGIMAAHHYGFTIERPFTAKPIDMQVGETWEERWATQLVVSYWQDNEFDVGYIETVDVRVSHDDTFTGDEDDDIEISIEED